MDLGNKILNLRKTNGYSQEELADKLSVTRQTISKWELNETSPDIKQAMELSKIFKVSLDELTNNDIKDILTEKISNTERLAGLTMKIIKAFTIIIIIFILIFGVYKIITGSTYAWFIGAKYDLKCTLDDKEYHYIIEYGDDNIQEKQNPYIEIYPKYKIKKLERQNDSSYLGGLIDISKYIYFDDFIEAVFGYFDQNNGTCDLSGI